MTEKIKNVTRFCSIHIRNAAVLGLTWAVLWALIAILAGVIAESLFDYWLENHLDPLAALAWPGFIAGILFYTVLYISRNHPGIEKRSLPAFAAAGGAVGLVMGILPLFLGSINEQYPKWLVIIIIVGSSVLLSIVSALVSKLLVRRIIRY